MPTSGKTITVTYDDGSTETYSVAAGDVATIVVTGTVLYFHGTLSGDSDGAVDWAIKLYKKYKVKDTPGA